MHTNNLIKESSPYLLQHAHNPVNWEAWSEEVLERAQAEDKMMLVSIGYSSCHWCHVMEREVFEDEQAAAYMNRHFICIKIDREERPDIDQVYMKAVQLMSGRGGWPLNCFTLPDGRPIYGGTYFPMQYWMQVMENLVDLFNNDRSKVEEYGARLTNGIAVPEWVETPDEAPFKQLLHATVEQWKQDFDLEDGGPNRAPKFPLPDNYLFLLRYAAACSDKEISAHVHHTLHAMALGGIYDQVGGGFARYSTDMEWKVPHFEKMLYDNGQLIALYSEAYRQQPEPVYRMVVSETVDFLLREMQSEDGAFYSALDADSEGKEGKFYIWTLAELKEVLGSEYHDFAQAYHLDEKGYWEDDHYILLSSMKRYAAYSQEKHRHWKALLLKARSKRTRPGLDDKILLSWNALLIRGLCEAYLTFSEEKYIQAAQRCMRYLCDYHVKPDGSLLHNSKNRQARTDGFLEDYAFFADACNALYQTDFNEAWLDHSTRCIEKALELFHDADSDLLYFTSSNSGKLIARKKEVHDNVTPASNSMMAFVLHEAGLLLARPHWEQRAERMLRSVSGGMQSYGSGFSRWGMLGLRLAYPYYQIGLKDVSIAALDFLREGYHPDRLYLTADGGKSSLDFFQGKGKGFYVCVDHRCSLPVQSMQEALDLMKP
jgi:uncharacterized protein YyaL (SSP411 family)